MSAPGLACEVCASLSFKYRCGTCRTRSCSLQCFKAHQAQCELVQAGQSAVTEMKSDDPVGTLRKTTDQGDLDAMFAKYPALRSKLKLIYDATLDSDTPHGHEGGRTGRFSKPWSEEEGFARAMALLQKELESSTADADDLKAFAAFIGANSG